jgi:CubicO group peptidase (beta-lactamase class C family)
LVCGTGAWANDLPTVKPEEVGLSSERLARIGPAMQRAVDSGEMAGALALVARRGSIAYYEEWGERDREADLPMTRDTIFRIYSMTKPITSVAVMMLYEEGHFFLNDPIGKYLPELETMTVSEEAVDGEGNKTSVERRAARPITIRDLLRHTAGLTYGVFGNSAVDLEYREHGLLIEDHSLETFVKKLGEIPLQYDPGTTWHYSVAVDVLGRLVEVVSGKPFDVFLEERIFAPLGMKDTAFWVPESKLPRLAQMYSPKGTVEGAEAWLRASRSKEIEPAAASASRNFVNKPAMPSGGGGLLSTVDDYLKFAQMMLNDGELGGVRLLSPKTVELMTSDHLGTIPMGLGTSGYGFGLGVAVGKGPGQTGELGSEGEYYWGGAAGTRFWIDPAEDLIGIFMIQILPHQTSLASQFRNFTYQAIVDSQLD